MPRARTLAPIVLLLVLAACGGSTTTTSPNGIGGTGGAAGSGTSYGSGGYAGLPGGGSGGSPGAAGAGGSAAGSAAAQACADLANAYCQKLESCAGVYVTVAFGDLASCNTCFAAACEPTIGAPQSGATADVIEACAGSIAAFSCADLLGNQTPDACKPHGGSLASGAACGDDWQCQSGRCAKPTASICGTCGTRGAVGASCSESSDCGYGLVCPSQTQKCAAPVPVGGSCDAGHPCALHESCVGAKSGTMGKCTTAASAGSSCDPQQQKGPGCDLVQGELCDPTTSTCQPIAFANPGGGCGYANGTYTTCSGGGACKLASGGTTGTCVAPAQDGASCDTTNDVGCLAGATCAGGTCELENPASCR